MLSELRSLRAQPGFTSIAVLSLALAIAANVSVFSIFNAIFWSSLPYPEAARLVYIHESVPTRGMSYLGVSYPDLAAWKEGNQTLTDVAAFVESGAYLTGLGETARVTIASVTFNLADTLGVRPLLGRGILAEEDRDGMPWDYPHGHRVVMLSYGFWQRRFGGARDEIGKSVMLDGLPYAIVGVLPPTAVYPANADVWAPLGHDLNSKGYGLDGVGRLKPGVTAAQALADLRRVHQHLVAGPESTVPVLMPLRDFYLGAHRTVSLVLLGAVTFVLLIACLNVTGLMLARGAARSREMAIRAALGAGRRRLMQQLLAESALVAVAAAAIGIAAGWAALQGMLRMMPDALPPWVAFHVDARFLGFALAITAVTTLLSGMAPALRASRVDAGGVLAGAGVRSSSAGLRRWLGALVVGEMAIAVALLAAGGLILVAFHRVTTRDPGFRPQNVLTFWIDPPDVHAEARQRIYQRVLEKLRSAPGVQAAGVTDMIPLGSGVMGHGDWAGWAMWAEGAPELPMAQRNVGRRLATPGYFRSLGIPLLAGRDFDEHDLDGTPRIAIVNQRLARLFWPDAQTVVGRRIRYRNNEWLTVAGVVGDVRHNGLEQEVRPEAFLPYSSQAAGNVTFAVRGSVEVPVLVAMAREALRQVDPAMAIYDVHTMQEMLDRSLWTRRTYSWLFGVFAAVALLMAVAGIYGVVSFAVAQRTREIGIRMALGAEPGQVVGQVLREGMVLVASGVALGLVGAWYATRLMGTLLAGVSPHDPWAYMAVVATLGAAALVANFVPARRAALADPMVALRGE